MTGRPSGRNPPPAETTSALRRVAAVLAVAAAGAMLLSLAIRRITSFDIGYHLAYGDSFLKHGRIVQTNRFIYTRLDERLLADPENLGPGCRYDAASKTYSFINANWLSQVILAAVHHAGGMTALSVLRAAMLAAIFAVMAATMRAGRLAWSWLAAGLVLAALTSYERFALRPELFGYLLLLVQWLLLVRPVFGWRHAAAVIGLQILAVNLHSYFLLGAAVAGAMFIDVLLRWLWRRTVTQEGAADLARRLRWLGVAFGGAILAAACNPWLIRGAVFPLQTLLYLRKHHIAGTMPALGSHPWAMIGELVPTLSQGMLRYRCTLAYIVVLVLAGAAAAMGLIRRRWGWLLVLAGITMVSLHTRRNMALGGLILAPLSLMLLADGWEWLRPKIGWPHVDQVSGGLAAAVALASVILGACWTVSIINSRFYFSTRRHWRFGLGAWKLMLPIEAAGWINEHQPPGRIWCDFSSSSNLAYLTGREMPLLTNTWAYPPYVMRENMNVVGLRKERQPDIPPAPPPEFDRLVADYGVGTVALRYTSRVPPLVGELARSPDWAVVHLGAKDVLFVRRQGPTAALADKCAITERSLDVGKLIEALRRSDPVPGFALHSAGSLLYEMGWRRAAIQVFRKCVDEFEPQYHEALWALAITLEQHGLEEAQLINEFLKQQNPGEARKARDAALAAFKEAEGRLQQTIRVKPGYGDAEKHLERVRLRIKALQPVVPAAGWPK